MPIEIEIDGHGVLEFPDGTSEDVIQSTVRRVTGAAPQTPPAETEPEIGLLGRMLGMGQMRDLDRAQKLRAKNPQPRQKNPFTLEQELAAAGSIAGPIGSGAGAGIGALLDGKGLMDAADAAGFNFAIPKILDNGIEVARPVVSNLFRRGAVRAMKAAVKPDRGYLEKMAGAKRGGIAKMETDIAETALDENVNPVRRKGLEATQDMIEAADAQKKAMVRAADPAPVRRSGRHADTAARWSLRRSRRGDAPGDDIAAVQSYLEDLLNSPKTSTSRGSGAQTVSFSQWQTPSAQGWASHAKGGPRAASREMKDLTPRELEETIEAGNARLKGMFSGQVKNAEIEARKAVQRARTADLDKVAGTKEVSQRMKRLIDLRNVGNIATRRAEAKNPVDLTDFISLSAGRPAVLAGSVGMKPPVLGEIALGMNRAGKSVLTPNETAEAVRRLMIALGLTSGE